MDVSGPPPTPYERARARRRRAWWASLALVVIAALAVGVSFLVDDEAAPESTAPPRDDASDGATPDEDDGDESTGDPTPGARPDVDVEGDDAVTVPDRATIEPDEQVVFDLFVEIDAAERVMIGFHDEVGAVIASTTDPALLEDAIRLAAVGALDDLAVLRDRLLVAARTPVRDTYVTHLDAWVTYLRAIEESPGRLAGDTTRWTIGINATADEFVRAVGRLRDDGLGEALDAFVAAILARGFDDDRDAQV